MKQRDLDGVYFRVERNGKYQNVCFTDLTTDEANNCIAKWDEYMQSKMVVILENLLNELTTNPKVGNTMVDKILLLKTIINSIANEYDIERELNKGAMI